MNNKELKDLLKQIDSKFEQIMPLLDMAGRALVEKAENEKGVKLKYSIGWEEGGIECLCLHARRNEEAKGFNNFNEGFEWERESIEPLFEGLKILCFDTPFGLGRK